MTKLRSSNQHRSSFPTHNQRSVGTALLVLAATILSGTSVLTKAAEQFAGPEPRHCTSDDLGYDVHGGQSNKISRVAHEHPLWVWVIYERGSAGRKIPRQDLPPQLRAKYPYDPVKVAEYHKAQAERAARERAAHQEAVQQKEQALLTQIAALEKQNVEDQKERNILLRIRAPGNGRRVRLAQLRDRQQGIEMRILALKRQIEQMHAHMVSLL